MAVKNRKREGCRGGKKGREIKGGSLRSEMVVSVNVRNIEQSKKAWKGAKGGC